MAKRFILLSLSIIVTSSLDNGAYGEGIEDFLVQICDEYPSWLAANYPDPSPQLYDPINVTVETDISFPGDYINATFTSYQMFGHANPENWQFSNYFIDLSSGTLQVMFQVRKTKFGGFYSAEGVYNGIPVSGQGTWNITTSEPSYIAFNLNYYGVKVTEDQYIDLNGGNIQSLHYYVPLGGIPSVREMEGLVAGGGGSEILLKNMIFNALEMQTQYMNEHPLPIPLNAYLQVAFATTPIPEMRKLVEERYRSNEV